MFSQNREEEQRTSDLQSQQASFSGKWHAAPCAAGSVFTRRLSFIQRAGPEGNQRIYVNFRCAQMIYLCAIMFGSLLCSRSGHAWFLKLSGPLLTTKCKFTIVASGV